MKMTEKNEGILSEIIFLGTGSSAGTPNLMHLMLDEEDPKYNDLSIDFIKKDIIQIKNND